MNQAMLKREGINLSKTTICHIVNGRVKHKKKKRKNLNPHKKRYEWVIPGQKLQLDVKYVPEFVGGQREQYFYWRAPTDTLANLNAAQTRWIESSTKPRMKNS